MIKVKQTIALATGIGLAVLVFPIQQANSDNVILDDLIVDGCTCIGSDCVDGESFGFDTLKLKENNLRIKFEDTSASAGFPTNDWQITANDSSSGGAEKFSIDDITGGKTPFTIEAGAPSHSLYVEDYGRIGLGTSTPSVELHIADGDTPTVRLEQNGASGWTPQTWDLASNETNFFIRDVTNGSKLPFRIRPGAPTSSLDIASSGNVGIGTASPDANLHLAGGNNDATFLFETDGNGWYMLNKNASGRFNITDDETFARVPFKIGEGAQQNLLKMGCGATDEVYISGNLIVAGTITPDYVFEDRYPLPSIEEHADVMWKEKHLPAVTKAKVDEEGKGVVNLGKRSQELLEELETAHIYIQQLNQKIKELEDRLTKIES